MAGIPARDSLGGARPGRLRLDRPRETEIENLHLTVLEEEHVLGLEIPMDQVLVARRRQAPCDAPADYGSCPQQLAFLLPPAQDEGRFRTAAHLEPSLSSNASSGPASTHAAIWPASHRWDVTRRTDSCPSATRISTRRRRFHTSRVRRA